MNTMDKLTKLETNIEEIEKMLTMKLIEQYEKDKKSGKKEIIVLSNQELTRKFLKLIKLLKK